MLFVFERIKNLLTYRDLAMKFAIRDIKGKYHNPVFGFLWAILLPLCMISIFEFVFSKILKIEGVGVPYFLYIMTAVFPWSYLQGAVSSATTSLVDRGNLLKKVYFPREIIPIAVVVSNLLSFMINLLVLFFFLLLYRIRVSKFCFLLPAIIFFHTLIIIGLSLATSSLYTRYRDVKYIIEVVIMILFYLTPGVYTLDAIIGISREFFDIYLLNPFVGLLSLYRLALLDGYLESLPDVVNISNIIISPIFSSVVIFILGYWLFRLQESVFADFM